MVFLILIFLVWVLSPFWVKSLPPSVQTSLSGSTAEASRLYSVMSAGAPKPFKPGHYDKVPTGALYVDNFAVKLNLDANSIAHPTAKLNGNVLTAPASDTKDQFLIVYPGTTDATTVTATQWNAYLKKHPNMFARIERTSKNVQTYVIGTKQYFLDDYLALNGAHIKTTTTVGQVNTNDPNWKSDQLDGDGITQQGP
ncbi:MAG: hypothetical protein K6T78_08845 [Alicyclobacillus sp.]|nr:hypothetical protein [Alicyclobacillus sp.]